MRSLISKSRAATRWDMGRQIAMSVNLKSKIKDWNLLGIFKNTTSRLITTFIIELIVLLMTSQYEKKAGKNKKKEKIPLFSGQS